MQGHISAMNSRQPGRPFAGAALLIKDVMCASQEREFLSQLALPEDSLSPRLFLMEMRQPSAQHPENPIITLAGYFR